MNEYKVHLSEIWDLMQEQIENGGEVKFSPKGISMLPLIEEGRDSVILKKAPDRLNKYDVVLYRRANGNFVLHRVVGVKKDSYIMCGDNQFSYEKNVKPNSILAIMTGLYQGDKYISVSDTEYITYSKRIVRKQNIRYNILRIKVHAKKLLGIK